MLLNSKNSFSEEHKGLTSKEVLSFVDGVSTFLHCDFVSDGLGLSSSGKNNNNSNVL